MTTEGGEREHASGSRSPSARLPTWSWFWLEDDEALGAAGRARATSCDLPNSS